MNDTSASPAPAARRPSHLFYQSRLRRPLVDRAEGIYLWDQAGRRMIDGSSGAMVVNIGHSNRHVLDAMKRQMDRVTFAYRLHFENEPAEELAQRVAEKLPAGLDRIFFVSGGSEAVEFLPQACAAMGGGDQPTQALEGDFALSLLPWRHARRACRHRL